MTTTAHDEILVGQIAIRFLLEGEQSGREVSMFEFVVPAGAKVPIAHIHDGYDETVYGLEWAIVVADLPASGSGRAGAHPSEGA